MQGANDERSWHWEDGSLRSCWPVMPTFPRLIFGRLVEGLTQVGTVTKTVTKEKATKEETQKLLKNVVSRLGLEPRVLALKLK